jgi:hypothetical protein
VNGHNTVKLVETERKVLKKTDIASLRVSFSGIFTVDAMIEGTIDDAGVWPYNGQIHLALVDLYNTYRPKSQLDRIQLDMDKLTIKMGDNDHPDVLFKLAMMVRKKYRRRRAKPTWDELISCIVTGSSLFYQTHFITIMLKLDHEQDGQIVMNAMKQLGNEQYTASHLSRTPMLNPHMKKVWCSSIRISNKISGRKECSAIGVGNWDTNHLIVSAGRLDSLSFRNPGVILWVPPVVVATITIVIIIIIIIMVVVERRKLVDAPDVRDIIIRRTAITIRRMLQSVRRIGLLVERKNLVQFQSIRLIGLSTSLIFRLLL